MQQPKFAALSIVIPCWNEADGLPTTLRAMVHAVSKLERWGQISRWELVFVDDGSLDGTPEILAEAARADARIQVATHPANRGLGAAIRTGLARASGDLVLYTDADMPCDIAAELPRAIRLADIYDADIVSAYRRRRAGEGPRRVLYSIAYNSLARAAFGVHLRDVNFAFKLMRRDVVDRLELRSEGSFIDVELLARAHAAGYKIIQFGTDYLPRTRGVSTLSSPRTVVKILDEMVTLGRDVRKKPSGRQPEARDPRVLVVNADDFGLTEGTADAILRAHQTGIVTSTSVLVLGRGFKASAARLGDAENLGIGVHLAAVGEDPPLLSAAEIPTLVDRRGRLTRSWRGFLSRAAAGQIDPADIKREFGAQIDAVSAFGISQSHLDTHQHLHLWPLVGDVVIDLAVERNIRAIRVPRSRQVFRGRPINSLASRLAQKATDAGLVHPGWAAGLDEAGRMHGDRLRSSLMALQRHHCDVELGCHPGASHDTDAYAWGYHWEQELRTLTSPEARRWVHEAGFVLGSYHDLARRSA